MKILHISHRHHISGGSDAVFMNTTALLQEAGHEVVPFCMASPDNLPSPFKHYFPRGADTGAPRLRDALRYFWNGDAARQLNALIEAEGPFDLAHLHIYHGKQTPAILPVLRRAGIPIVQTLHEYKLACPVYTMKRDGAPCDACLPKPGLKPLLHRCKDGSLSKSAVMLAEFQTSRALGDIRHIDRLICVSAFQKSVMERAGIPPAKLDVLHNFTEDCAAPPANPDGYFLYFGRIERLKGLPTLIDAAEAAGCQLHIAGEGNWQEDLSRHIAGSPNIQWHGFEDRAGLDRLIAGARAVVVPSEWYENCPMSVIEAKMRGRAIIATRIGGIPELVNHGVDGLLVTPGDTEALTDALQAMTPERAAKMGAAARADARRRFTSDQHLVRLHMIYEEIRSSVRRVHPGSPPTPARA